MSFERKAARSQFLSWTARHQLSWSWRRREEHADSVLSIFLLEGLLRGGPLKKPSPVREGKPRGKGITPGRRTYAFVIPSILS